MGIWPLVPSPSEQSRVRPGRARRPGSRSRPGPWCCARRPGQASPKTPSRSPTPTPHRPPPPPLTPTLPPPDSGTQLRGRWRPSRRAQRRCSGRLIHGMCSLVHPVPRGPATQPEPQAPTGRQRPWSGREEPFSWAEECNRQQFPCQCPGVSRILAEACRQGSQGSRTHLPSRRGQQG